MKLDKAIEVLDAWRRENCPPPLPDEFNALHLGIEALKLVLYVRNDTWFEIDTKLPGETKE